MFYFCVCYVHWEREFQLDDTPKKQLLITAAKMAGIIVSIIAVSMLYNLFFSVDSPLKDRPKEYSFFCTTQLAYDFTKNIVKDSSEVFLIDRESDVFGEEIASLTSKSLRSLRKSSVIIYCGDEKEPWVKNTLKTKIKSEKILINMLADVKYGDEISKDEHISQVEWQSVDNARIILDKIYTDISALNSIHSEEYMNNYFEYLEKFSKLESEYKEIKEKPKTNKMYLCTDIIPKYNIVDFNVEYFNCTVDGKIDFVKMQMLEEQKKEIKEPSVFFILVSEKYMHEVCSSFDEENVFKLNDFVTHNRDFDYIDYMRENLLGFKKL